jgi:hypothetical protein
LGVSAPVEGVAEPVATERLRALLAGARERLTASQRAAIAMWDESRPLDRPTTTALRFGPIDGATLRRLAGDLVKRGRAPSRAMPATPGAMPRERFDEVAAVLDGAAARPAVASALLWSWLSERDGGVFAAHLVQRVRELAGLPGLRRRFAADEERWRSSNGAAALADAFADRQVEDACVWMEHVAAPLAAAEAAPLARQQAEIERMRATAPRVSADEFAPFAQLAATFVVQLSARRLDPLGFPLSRDVELDRDPSVERRIEIAAWARLAGRLVNARGQMFVVGIAVRAPWPLRLELIAAELGVGACGGLGMMLRLSGAAPVALDHAPMLLCFPGEPTQERGPRFERWLADAYPAAARAWQAWS